MLNAGIVAEYNPFHTGHAYQIAQTRGALGEDAAVTAVMSGNWVQQAGCAVADKWVRAEMALRGGVDLVLELPTVWATASAEAFARGAAAILEGSGVVDAISFGSECGQADPLAQVAACLDTPACRWELARCLGEGRSFPAARQEAVRVLLGEEAAGLLSTPNNNLGVEYIRALRALSSEIRPMTVRREGAPHGSLTAEEKMPFRSATQLRACLEREGWAEARPFIPDGCREVLASAWDGAPSLFRLERAMLARVRTMGEGDWAALPDSGAAEGLPRRLVRAGREARSMEEFYALAKTRRYTHARLRRLALWAFLGVRREDVPPSPPYLRVLAFNRRGQALLREMRERARLPILTKPAHARRLDWSGRRLFELEARCTDLYDLCRKTIPAPGREWVTGPVRLEKNQIQATGAEHEVYPEL